jgi:hypothetical protein
MLTIALDTSLHMLNAFVKFKKANVIIEMAYAQGYHFDKSQLEMAIANLYDVLEEQRQAFKLARESPTLLSEFTLTALKLSAAYDLADQTEVFNEKRDAIKDWIALMEGRQSCYPGFKSPCEWFSIKKRQQYRDNIPDM